MVINNDYNEDRAGIQQMLANTYGYRPSDVYQDVYMQNAREVAYNDIQEQNARADARKQAELLATNIGMEAVARSSVENVNFDPTEEYTELLLGITLLVNQQLEPYGSGIKYMAMQDPYVLGTSIRTYAARFAGSREILKTCPGSVEEINEFQDALAYATAWIAVLTLALGNTGTTIGKSSQDPGTTGLVATVTCEAWSRAPPSLTKSCP